MKGGFRGPYMGKHKEVGFLESHGMGAFLLFMSKVHWWGVRVAVQGMGEAGHGLASGVVKGTWW